MSYVVTIYLLPQDSTEFEWLYVFHEAASKTRSTMLQSADDAAAGVRNGAPGSKVIIYAPKRWTGGDIVKWFADRGCVSEVREFPPLTQDYVIQLLPRTISFLYDYARGWLDGRAMIAYNSNHPFISP